MKRISYQRIGASIGLVILAGCAVNNVPDTTRKTSDHRIVVQAQQLVAETMRDPEATRFKPEVSAYVTGRGDYIVCGTLNAKNAMGGYVGYRPYYVRIRDGKIAAVQVPSELDSYGIELGMVNKVCADAASGNVMVDS